MDYISKMMRSTPKAEPKGEHDHLATFTKSWTTVKDTLHHPDERQLTRGIISTDAPAELRNMVESLVYESTTFDDTTGACLEYILKNDVLNNLVLLSENDRPFGIKAEVVKTMLNLVVLMDETFLVHAAVHKAVLRLLRACVRDESQMFDGGTKAMGAAGAVRRSMPSDYEDDLVDLMCVLCSRIRTYHELLPIFFYDKHLFHTRENLQSLPAEVPEDDVDDEPDTSFSPPNALSPNRTVSPTPSSITITSAQASSFSRKPEYEFLLYNYLLRFVHREGRIGDLARAGLLFLIDVAMSSGQLRSTAGSAAPQSDPLGEAAIAFAEYILEGDFADVLAAGIGAVYSMLPSKLIMRRESKADIQSGGMVLGGLQPDPDDEADLDFELEKSREFGLDVSTSADFRVRLDHFVKMVEFVQDVLQRQPLVAADTQITAASLLGSSIATSVLEFFRSSFLSNVLYPSILESSDLDGSAVAVISYIDALLTTVKDHRLAELIIDFLTSEEDPKSHVVDIPDSDLSLGVTRRTKRKPVKKKRPKSTAMVLLQLETNPRMQSPYFNSLGRFTVKDLLLTNLESKSQATATAALNLLHTLLTQHSRLALDRLLTLVPETKSVSLVASILQESDEPRTPQPPKLTSTELEEQFFAPTSEVALLFRYPDTSLRPRSSIASGGHTDEIELYRSLVARIDPAYTPDAYSSADAQYLQDAQDALDRQEDLLGLAEEVAALEDALPPPRKKYSLSPTDPLLTQLLSSTQRFFAHSSEQNVALTGVLHAIACSPQLSLAGWLVYDASASPPSPSSFPSTPTQPALYTTLSGLISQLPQYRLLAPEFELYLSQRRNGLLSSSNLADALNVELSFPIAASVSERAPPSAAEPPSTPAAKYKRMRSSGFVSYFSPRRAKAHAQETQTSEPQARKSFETPIGQHYRETTAVSLTPLKAAPPAKGPWSPARHGRKAETAQNEDDVFVAWGGQKEEKFEDTSESESEVTTTLSDLLDNIVVLEETLKELAAVLQLRRILGMDE